MFVPCQKKKSLSTQHEQLCTRNSNACLYAQRRNESHVNNSLSSTSSSYQRSIRPKPEIILVSFLLNLSTHPHRQFSMPHIRPQAAHLVNTKSSLLVGGFFNYIFFKI